MEVAGEYRQSQLGSRAECRGFLIPRDLSSASVLRQNGNPNTSIHSLSQFHLFVSLSAGKRPFEDIEEIRGPRVKSGAGPYKSCQSASSAAPAAQQDYNRIGL